MFYIYILYSSKADKFYIGYSADPIKRLDQHNNYPKTTFTSKFRPWELKTYFPISASRSEAMRVERFIKNQKNRDFILKIIEADGKIDRIAQLVRVPGTGMGEPNEREFLKPGDPLFSF